MRLACIGIGSNAIRLLTAEDAAGALRVIRRERRGTRLFAGLVDGTLTKESIQTSVDAVAQLARLAHADGAVEVFVFATSAARDAKNGDEFARAVEKAAGAKLIILSGEEEAVFSFIGASDGGSCGVIDIGGGSTEFTLGEGADILGALSLQMGAVRMHAQLPIASVADYEETMLRCRRIIQRDARSLLAMPARKTWVGVGGTMTTLGAMERHVPLFDPDTCEGMSMPRETIGAWGRKLAAMGMDARRHVEGLMPHRADIIPSGIAILEAAMGCFGVDALVLSAHGNMDGYLKKKFAKRVDR